MGIMMEQLLIIVALFLAMIAPILVIELTDWLCDRAEDRRINGR